MSKPVIRALVIGMWTALGILWVSPAPTAFAGRISLRADSSHGFCRMPPVCQCQCHSKVSVSVLERLRPVLVLLFRRKHTGCNIKEKSVSPFDSD